MPVGPTTLRAAEPRAAAVLHSVDVRTAAQRAVQRTPGTVAGLLLALGVLALGPGPVALGCALIVVHDRAAVRAERVPLPGPAGPPG
ncbi:FUSC family protein [Streptomyces litmocidini]|uniref:FUSC family protein n=1 Tax=Streptomyces litmocidini TaxID=67318 RepID=UPI0037010989